MPEMRWGNRYATERTEPTYHDLLRENMRLRDQVEDLQAELKDAGEREAKAKLAATGGRANRSPYRVWIVVLGGAVVALGSWVALVGGR